MALLGDAGAFVTDGVTVTVAKLQSGEAVSAQLPDTIEAEVASCSASMKARHCVKRSALGLAACWLRVTHDEATKASSSGLTAAARQNERKDGSQLKAATLVNGATLQARGTRRLRHAIRCVALTRRVRRRCPGL